MVETLELIFGLSLAEQFWVIIMSSTNIELQRQQLTNLGLETEKITVPNERIYIHDVDRMEDDSYTIALKDMPFTFAGAIILGLLIYVVFRCKANKKRTQMAANYAKQNPGYQIVQQLPQLTHSPTSPIVFLQNSGKTGE